MNKERISNIYKFATFIALIEYAGYVSLRIIENTVLGKSPQLTLIIFAFCTAAAALVVLWVFLLRNSAWVPFLTASTYVTFFIMGALYTKDWSYYFIGALSIFGLVTLYGKFNAMIAHFIVNSIVNIFILIYIYTNFPKEYSVNQLANFVLFSLGALFMFLLFRRITKREGIADRGLNAFSSLLDSTPNMMVILDENKKVRYISGQMARFAGVNSETTIGRPFLDLFSEENLRLMFADILDADEFFEDTREIDIAGEPHYFKIIADGLANVSESMFIEITDITQTVLASLRADEARIEAEYANKSKSSFLATMSHEIRTPMNAIIGISDIEINSGDVKGRLAESLLKINSSGHVLLGIINDILDLSKIETGKLELNPVQYDMPSLINDAVQLNIVRIGSKPIEFLLDVSSELPSRLIGDELRLKQVLNNVLSNAFKYTSKGEVKLSVSHTMDNGVVLLQFKVSDTGQGMKKEDVERLFDEYSRFNADANRVTEGTGLGMNITQKLVALMDGSINVESEYGKGSTVTITVKQQPVNGEAIGKELAEKLRNFTFTLDNEKIRIQINREYMPYGKVLVVDDVETNLYVARGLLTPYGLKIKTAISGFETLDLIQKGEVYDVIFMDHMMPKMDGIETTRRLREFGYKGTIIALTANAIIGTDKKFKENSFDDYISKPIDIRHLNAMLNKWIRDKQSPETLQEVRRTKAIVHHKTEPAGIDRTLLAIFKRDAQNAITTLRKTAESGDYKLFTTTAHAMKSASANIGENNLSEQAKQLESAGLDKDAEYIAKHLGEFLSRLTEITGNEEAEQAAVIITEDVVFLRESLELFSAACDDFDSTKARGVLKQLQSRSWKAETTATIDEMADMVRCSDFDEAVEAAAKLIAKI